ncbi:MAG: hypothetical protein Q8R16_01430, partial [bacterium]|nr:hypothetical protein [bacterium]
MPRSVERRNNSSASAPEHETPPQDTPPAERAPATREELERRLADTTGRVVAELATAAEASQRRALESTARVGGAAEGAALLDRQQEELRQAAEAMDRELSDLGGNENSRGALVATVEDKMRTLREQAASAEA